MKKIFFLAVILLCWINLAVGQMITGVTPTAEKCYTKSDGTVTVNFNAGSGGNAPPYDIVLLIGTEVKYTELNVNVSPFTFVNVAAGTYTARLRKNGSYIGSPFNNIVVGSQRPIAFSTNGRPIAVDGDCGEDGYIEATVVGGNANNTGYIMNIENQVGNPYTAYAPLYGEFLITLPAGTYSIISIKDSEGCELEEDLTSSQPLILHPSVGVTAITVDQDYEPAKCNGAANGKFAVQVTEGTSSEYYFYLETNFEGFSTDGYHLFKNLPEGTYTYWVFDDNFCSDDGTVVITQPASLSVSVASTNVTCITGGVSNGVVTATASGGTEPYKYRLTGDVARGWQSSNVFSNLPAGDYTVYVDDANGCGEVFSSPPVTIASTPLSVEIVIDAHVLCKDKATGKAHAVVSGGNSSNVTYSWTGPNGFTSAASIIEDIKAGSYKVEVSDGGCITDDTKIINEPTLALTAAINNGAIVMPSCGQSDGSIPVTASGGTGSYQYSKDGGISYQSGNVFTNLPAGNYSIRVKDANGCTYDISPYTLSSPKPIEFTLSPNPANLNCSEGTQSITINISDSESGFIMEYQVNSDPWTEISGNTASFTKGAGTWSVTVRYKSVPYTVCTTTKSVQINAPNPLVLNTPTQKDITCNDGNDGEITVTSSGGASGNTVTFHVTGPNGYSSSNTTGLFTGLKAGNYTITMTNLNGCTSTPSQQTITLTEPAVITIVAVNANPDQVTCSGDLTTLTVQATGDPSRQLVYSLDKINWQSTSIFEVSSGTHNIWVGYQVGTEVKCEVSTSITITGRAAIKIDKIEPQVPIELSDCNTTSVNVTITASIEGGGVLSDLRYSMGSGYQVSKEFRLTPSAAGYPVSVQYVDDPHCTVYGETVIITTPVQININNVDHTDILDCPESRNGFITIDATSGGGRLEYSIGSGYFENGGIFQNLPAGKYNVSVRNYGETCAQTWGEIEIKAPAVIVFTDVTPGTVPCASDPLTSIKITATGEAGKRIEYSINGGANWKSGDSGEEVIFDRIQGGATYTVTARYESTSCTVVTRNITIPAPLAEIKFTATFDPLCADQTTTYLHISVDESEGGLPLEYYVGGMWYDTNSIPVEEGNYYVTVRYKNTSCAATWKEIIVEKLAPIANVSLTMDPYLLPCNDPLATKMVTITTDPIPGNPLITYIVASGIDTYTNTDGIFQLPVGSYEVYAEYAGINACRQQAATSLIILSDSPIENVSLTTIDNLVEKILDCNDETNLKVTPQDPDYRYSLNGGNELTSVELETTKIETAGSYSVMVWDVNNPNCKQTSNTVTIIQPGKIDLEASHVTVIQPQCPGGTGSVMATYPHQEPLKYILTPQHAGVTQTNNDGQFYYLSGGTYILRVEYVNYTLPNCAGEYTITIETAPVGITGVSLTAASYELPCEGAPTTLTALATGSKPIEFRLDGGSWQTGVEMGVVGVNQKQYKCEFTGVGSGNHEVEVRYAGTNCMISKASLPQPIAVWKTLQMDVYVGKWILDCGESTTTVTLTALNKEPGKDVQFSIDGGKSWETASDSYTFPYVYKGNYTPVIRYRDTGCEITGDVITINNDVNLSIHVEVSPQALTCTTGHATITVYATGEPGKRMEFSLDGTWNSGSSSHNGTDTYIFDDVPAGYYDQIAVRYANTIQPCPKYYEPVIVAGISFTAVAGHINCFGDANGSMTINITQGIAPFTVKITAPAVDKQGKPVPAYDKTFNNSENPLVIKNLFAREYTIKVFGKTILGTDCELTKKVKIIEPSIPLKYTIVPRHVCSNEEFGDYDPTINGGQMPYFFEWYYRDDKNKDFEWIARPLRNQLKPGEYLSIAEDDLGCTDTTTFEIIEMNKINADLIPHNIKCNETVGSIEIKKKLPIRDYAYEVRNIDKGTLVPQSQIQYGVDSDFITGLESGKYRVSMWDTEGRHCDSWDKDIEINQENEIKNIKISEPKCDTKGSITFEVWGKNDPGPKVTCNNVADPDTPLTGSWDGQKWKYNVELLKGGLTVISVEDENGCTNTWEREIEYITILEFVKPATITHNDCPDDEKGKIEVKAIDKDGGVWEKFDYFLYEGNATTSENLVDTKTTLQPYLNQTVTFINRPSGLYTLSMRATRSGNECFTEDYPVEITGASDIAIGQITITDNACKGDENGSIAFTITGDKSIPQYEWTVNGEQGIALATDGVANVLIRDLLSGTYTVDIAYGSCTLSDYPLGDVEDGQSFETTINPTPVHGCEEEDNGGITIEIQTNNSASFSYQYWPNGEIGYPDDNEWVDFNGLTATISGLAEGFYDVIVRNSVGCFSDTETIEVTKETVMTVTYNEITPVSCNGKYDGVVEIIISGGSGNYTVDDLVHPANVNPPDFDEENMILSNVTGGTYLITIVDEENECTETLELEIVVPKVIEIKVAVDTPTCFTQGAQADIDVKVTTLNVYSGLYHYSFYNTQNDQLLKEENILQPEIRHRLPSGDYRVTVGIDDSECIAEEMFNIQIPQSMELDVTFTKTPDADCNYTTGISINVSGGTAPYTYFVDVNGSIIEQKQMDGNSASLESSLSGSYYIEVTDDKGCPANKTEEVVLPNGIEVDADIHEPLCTNSSKGFIVMSNKNYNYVWDDYGKGVVVGHTLSELDAGTYWVTISDGPCSKRQDFTLVPSYDLKVSATFRDYPDESIIEVCPYSDLIYVTGSVSGEPMQGAAEALDIGTLNHYWETYESEDLVFFLPDYPEIKVKPGNGKIKLTAEVTVHDFSRIPERTENCKVTSTLTVVLSDVPVVSMGLDTIYIPKQETYRLETEITGDYLFESVKWSAKPTYGYADFGLTVSPVEIYPPEEHMPYTLILTVENDIGCKVSDSIYIARALDFFIPNAFTPNGDGFHETWEFRNIEQYNAYYDIHVIVFLRAGIQVYEGKGYNNSTVVWDGKRNGQDLPIGTYYYVVTFAPKLNGRKFEFKGTVTIMR